MSGEEIKELVGTVAQQSNTVVQQQDHIARLIADIEIMPGVSAPVAVAVQPARVVADVVGAERVQRLAMRAPFPGTPGPAQRPGTISRFLRFQGHPRAYVPWAVARMPPPAFIYGRRRA